MSRTFRINYESNCFELNGKPFQYASGSFHYFRALPETWSDRMRMMRNAGLNALDTYVEWALHNPEDGKYNFTGIADVERFLKLANEHGFYVILRPGPYICAERDNGGIPYWLFSKYPNIRLRTNDSNYLTEIRKWYEMLMPRMQRFLYENGGPIILVQVENEYGVSKLCDKNYLNWLRDETEKYVNGKAVLFTVDIPNSVEEMRCGTIDNVFATTDFGIDRIDEMDSIWKMLRQIQPKGPLVNSEFYPGWLTHWQEKNQRRSPEIVANSLRKILTCGASVNIYMFFGGTNFGFTAGANDWGTGKYMADITSYDYDAVMNEAGDPNDQKYLLVKNVIEQHFGLKPNILPQPKPKMTLNAVQLNELGTILSANGRSILGKIKRMNLTPLSFEQLGQFSGLILYETKLPNDIEIDPTILTVHKLHDRAYVFVDNKLIGILSRENAVETLPLIKTTKSERKLQILVENQGRINFNVFDDFKGILGSVTFQKFDGTHQELLNWSMTGFPLELEDIEKFAETFKSGSSIETGSLLENGPVLFHGRFHIDAREIHDTYFDSEGWGKGILFVNGLNLGRYWPLVGPQKTLYVPKEILIRGENKIYLLEYQQKRNDVLACFANKPSLDG